MANSFRPNTFAEFIGQEKIIDTLKVLIKSSKLLKQPLDHIIFHGPPGLGKTSLAIIISKELNKNIRFAQGPMLEKKADILSLFGSLSKGDIIFIDEIHGINKNVEELIYSAMEDGVIDISIGTDGDTRIVRMKLPPFTIIGATTKITKISKPLKDRFGYIAKLVGYDDKEISTVIKNTSNKLKLFIPDEIISFIVEYTQNVPRIANNLLKRIKDFQIANDIKKIDKKFITNVFDHIGLYKSGLNELQITYLKTLSELFYEKWVSQDNISSILNEPRETIDMEIEPILLKKSFIEKSSRGRRITNKGIKYISSYNLV